MKNKKGFTLIEMLVVISIIGILAALSVVSFSSTQKQARDTARKSDLKSYQNALEAYANKNGGMYPAWSNTYVNMAGQSFCNGSMAGIITDSGGNGTCPTDPKNTTDSTYYYRYRSDGGVSTGAPVATQYVLWAKLENVSTTTYWVVCSNGKSGTSTSPNSAGTCPI